MRRASLELGERILPAHLGHAQRQRRLRQRRVMPVDEDDADALGQVCRNMRGVGVQPRVRGGNHATARMLNDRGHSRLARGRGLGRVALVGRG